MAPPSPAVASWELTLRLRQRRAQLAIDVKTITTAIGMSRSYWVLVENDRRILGEDKMKLLLDLFDFDSGEQRELMALRAAAKERGWWTSYSALFADELLKFYGMEHGAVSIRGYEGVVMPGLLQTEAYMRALMTGNAAISRPVEINQRVEVRLRRQERLYGDDPLQLSIVMGEAAIAQHVGGKSVMREQLLHLISAATTHSETIDLRIIPLTSTRGAIPGSTFQLLDFESARLPKMSWLETPVTGDLSDDAIRVRDIAYVFERAHATALSSAASIAKLEETIRQLG